MKRFDKFEKLVNVVIDSNSISRKAIIRASSEAFIKFIGDIALNILNEVIHLSVHFLNKLDEHFSAIRKIGAQRVKARTRRKLCVKNYNAVALLLKASYNYLFTGVKKV